MHSKAAELPASMYALPSPCSECMKVYSSNNPLNDTLQALGRVKGLQLVSRNNLVQLSCNNTGHACTSKVSSKQQRQQHMMVQ
jgi:hypothetical protein